jgi:hypothetical protein
MDLTDLAEFVGLEARIVEQGSTSRDLGCKTMHGPSIEEGNLVSCWRADPKRFGWIVMVLKLTPAMKRRQLAFG